MASLTRSGVALILVSVLSLLAFAAELTYVLWYRRRFQREPPAGADDPEIAAAEGPYGSPNSKELLLYFLCVNNQSRNGRASAVVVPAYSFAPAMAPGFSWPGSAVSNAKPLPPPPPPLPPLPPTELAQPGDLYGPEVQFTVRVEMEVEGEVVGPDGGGVSPRSERQAARCADAVVAGERGAAGEKEEDVSPEEVLEGEKNVVVTEPVFEFTPFSTPGGPTPFYTPPPSPPPELETDEDLELAVAGG